MEVRPKSARRSSSASLSLVLSSSLGRPHCQLERFSTVLRSLSPVPTHSFQVSLAAVASISTSHPRAARSWILFPSRVMCPMFPARIAIFDPFGWTVSGAVARALRSWQRSRRWVRSSVCSDSSTAISSPSTWLCSRLWKGNSWKKRVRHLWRASRRRSSSCSSSFIFGARYTTARTSTERNSTIFRRSVPRGGSSSPYVVYCIFFSPMVGSWGTRVSSWLRQHWMRLAGGPVCAPLSMGSMKPVRVNSAARFGSSSAMHTSSTRLCWHADPGACACWNSRCRYIGLPS
mmetsp:Transcript_7222/g.14670  ORF Transcript_7222/g.14670 Transcript_7222/m.14670 type:complete len:289 (+) Transcript_7222:371-1237(+)